MPQHTIQHRTLAAYLALFGRHTHWQRRLVALSATNDAQPLAFAALAAGAAVLWITDDAAELRQANQSNLTDFNVDSLAEAVRILKNEIRRGLPVSVGLLAEPESALEQMVEKGMQPDGIVSSETSPARTLQARGAALLFTEWSTAGLAEDSAGHWRMRQAQDAALLCRVSMADPARAALAQRWLAAAARLFPRDLHRAYHPDWLYQQKETP